MVFPVIGGTQSTGDLITNSARFEDGDSPDLRFDGQMAAGNRRTFTYSFWTKRGNLGINTCVFSVEASDVVFRFGTSDDIQFKDVNNDSFNLSTNNVFRDTSAWYHIVVAVDTTDGTAANRIKLYVNGTQQTTDFGTASYPSQNHDTEQNNNGDSMYIGARTDSTTEGSSMTQHYDGYIAYFHLIDGAQKAASDFGETNENGVWVPKLYTGTYGTNGFKLEFKGTGTSADTSGKGADTSGQGNHFDDTNMTATEITTDTPQNNFATLNLLDNYYASSTFSEGSVKMVSASTGSGTSTNAFKTSTFGLTSGKWYWEAKLSNATGYDQIGISQLVASSTSDHLGNSSSAYSIRGDTGNFMNNNSASSYGVSFTTNDIISVALDLDNNLIYFYKNGTVMNSGTGKSISAGTYFPSFGKQDPAAVTWEVNFGNPSFSISSGNTDGLYGNFEYAVPSGYYALCTKRLAEYG
mgnify:CR=1 FL=1